LVFSIAWLIKSSFCLISAATFLTFWSWLLAYDAFIFLFLYFGFFDELGFVWFNIYIRINDTFFDALFSYNNERIIKSWLNNKFIGYLLIQTFRLNSFNFYLLKLVLISIRLHLNSV
jgi:hypothetical protein